MNINSDEDVSFDKYLDSTYYIDSDNPLVLAKAVELTQNCHGDVEKALALFYYVRDEIIFGFTSQFHNQKASDIIREKIGFSMTKTTLFIALLRCCMIPSRQVFVNITADILLGFGVSGPYMDHCYTEVYLCNKWIKVDGYIIDVELFSKVSAYFADNQDMNIGLGIHRNGTIYWDGENDAMIQYVNDDLVKYLSTITWGIYEDVGDFYKQTQHTNNGYDVFFPLNLITYIAYFIPNQRIHQARQGYLGFIKLYK